MKKASGKQTRKSIVLVTCDSGEASKATLSSDYVLLTSPILIRQFCAGMNSSTPAEILKLSKAAKKTGSMAAAPARFEDAWDVKCSVLVVVVTNSYLAFAVTLT